jgi:hypothetical protein
VVKLHFVNSSILWLFCKLSNDCKYELAVCDVVVSGKSYISVLRCALTYKLVQSVCVPVGFLLRASFTEQMLLLLACYTENNEQNVKSVLLMEGGDCVVTQKLHVWTC